MHAIDAIKQKLKGLSGDNKSVLTLVGGTVVAQGLSFLFSPITTRLFSPEVFGDLSVFTSITGIVGVVVCLRYELAIVLPQDDDEGFSLLKLCFIFTSFVSVVTGLVLLFGGEAIYTKFGAKNLAGYWYYVPISLFLTGIIQASNYWLTRTRQFTVLSWNKVVPVIAVNLVSIGLGFAGNRDIGARLFAILVSNIANIAVIARVVAPELKPKKHARKYSYRELIGRYKNFLVYDIWGALLNNLSWMLVPILMNAYYGSNAAGQYSIGMRVIQMPASLIGASISQVFLKNASEKRYSKTLYPYCIETTKKLFKYTAPIVIVLLLLGKPVFHFVFGDKWDLAGVYTQILAPWALLWFCASPMHSVFTITQKQNVYLVFSIVNLATRFLSLYLGKMMNSDIWGIAFFSISGFIVYGISLILALREAKKSDLSPANS
ncbi:putative Polysaccharide biosynthesis protein [uncultured spirochete]|uniref:Putative Polysaccharide biosynthesis protein n=1 Tax=uncultured spirochete TaxID=156406 RepID=A0A3P3XS45_9SPIR|nr:putative Polysaccharide biosynthesis protein [uncultured spirochete]